MHKPTSTSHPPGTFYRQVEGWDEGRAIHGLIIVQSSAEDGGRIRVRWGTIVNRVFPKIKGQ